MRPPKFEYLEPKTLKEAARTLASHLNRSVPLTGDGGTDLFVNMKYRLIEPRHIINLKRIAKLACISDCREGLKI